VLIAAQVEQLVGTIGADSRSRSDRQFSRTMVCLAAMMVHWFRTGFGHDFTWQPQVPNSRLIRLSDEDGEWVPRFVEVVTTRAMLIFSMVDEPVRAGLLTRSFCLAGRELLMSR
jgi:hypothetical protein